jgi:hypothetical protein
MKYIITHYNITKKLELKRTSLFITIASTTIIFIEKKVHMIVGSKEDIPTYHNSKYTKHSHIDSCISYWTWYT